MPHSPAASSEPLTADRPGLLELQLSGGGTCSSQREARNISAVGTAWEAVCAGVPDLSRAIAQARLAITHGMHEAVRAVDLVFHAAGTNAIYRTHPLERYFRDIHMAVQHNAAFPAHI